MELLRQGFFQALRLVAGGDPLVLGAALRSLWISLVAVALAGVCGVAIGSLLGRKAFWGRSALVFALRVGMGLPTVLVGLVCYGLLSRRGPLGGLDLLYTPWAIIVGQFLLALPIVASLTYGAIRSLDSRVADTARTLGARPLRRWWTYLCEARLGVVLALVTAFSRCVTELGIAVMVGGNIKYHTRTLSTATALETAQGEFARGVAMGLILLAITLVVVATTALVSRSDRTP